MYALTERGMYENYNDYPIIVCVCYIRLKITFSEITESKKNIYLYTLPTAHLFYMLIY